MQSGGDTDTDLVTPNCCINEGDVYASVEAPRVVRDIALENPDTVTDLIDKAAYIVQEDVLIMFLVVCCVENMEFNN